MIKMCRVLGFVYDVNWCRMLGLVIDLINVCWE